MEEEYHIYKCIKCSDYLKVSQDFGTKTIGKLLLFLNSFDWQGKELNVESIRHCRITQIPISTDEVIIIVSLKNDIQ